MIRNEFPKATVNPQKANGTEQMFSHLLSKIFFDSSIGLYEPPSECPLRYYLSFYDLRNGTWHDTRINRSQYWPPYRKIAPNKSTWESSQFYQQQLQGDNLPENAVNFREGTEMSRDPKGQWTLHRRVLESIASVEAPSTRLACSSCGKLFNSRRGFHFHAIVHSGLTPFVCTSCGAKFRLRAHLKKHYKDCPL